MIFLPFANNTPGHGFDGDNTIVALSRIWSGDQTFIPRNQSSFRIQESVIAFCGSAFLRETENEPSLIEISQEIPEE
jgi:hypothetical protein